jgi:hypothetical protein
VDDVGDEHGVVTTRNGVCEEIPATACARCAPRAAARRWPAMAAAFGKSNSVPASVG